MNQPAAPSAYAPARQAFLDALHPLHLAPLWTRYQQLLTPTPQGKARPYLLALCRSAPASVTCR